MKKFLTTVCVGAGLLAMASLASAETFNVRIYGASAQKKFWTTAAPSFLSNVLDCDDFEEYGDVDGDDDFGGTRGIQCNVDNVDDGNDGDLNDDEVFFHYAAKASFDGVLSVQNQRFEDGSTFECGTEFGQREFGNNACFPGVSGTCDVACQDVTIGASDVSGAAFTQSSSGFDITDWRATDDADFEGPISRTFSGISALSTFKNPIVVPFGFFANKSVTVSRCEAPVVTADSTYPKWGNPCDPDASNNSADCIGYTSCVSDACVGGANPGGDCSANGVFDCPDAALAETSCVAKPISDISRLQAVLIFSGQVNNWSAFGTGFPTLDIVRCMRHAGSGTHATFDIQIFKGTGQAPASATDASTNTWLHSSSSDLAKCIDIWDGAVGYLDADKNIKSTKNNTVALKYQGYLPTRENIKNGNYNFWAAQFTYYSLPELQSGTTEYPAGTEELVLGATAEGDSYDGLLVWAGQEANLTTANFGPRALYWATQDEMNVEKANSDRNFPNAN